ncbi:DUF6745 domain-containing protein [Aerosakkonema funiforme]|uniref:DUF6745 domain-containing protein n=2 Tax=Oscillatoriophycideae TaxID=1301283 RepID=A0A926ZJP7_9CYAN|nr:hypothetical protein [Aerosakkonema funiforme]MBD2184884.1 hypothetical protein [Aerosakkonema funiforme FACHB-1375]
MSQPKITSLTPEQEALIPVYREKWLRIALSTEPIDKEKAAEAVTEAYVLIGRKKPHIIFCDSPYAVDKTREQLVKGLSLPQLINSVSNELESELWDKLVGQLWEELTSRITNKLEARIWEDLEETIGTELIEQFDFDDLINPEELAKWCTWIDFCISVLNLSYSSKTEWILLQNLIKSCWIICTYQEVAIICDRPRILSFDNQNRLHAEGSAAIQYADGFSFYAYHGVTLPEKYGKLHPNQWQAKWLLEEKNAELRRVLIQGIGYSRICQELQAIELDSWQEYTLLKIDSNVDIEPIYLLKMTCPSTGFIHALRVPPNVESAREAITWVNGGIDPEEFSLQT